MSDDFLERLGTLITTLQALEGLRLVTAQVNPGCSEDEIGNVHRALGYELSGSFLAYYRAANGASVRWETPFGGGGFQLLSLSQIYLTERGYLFGQDEVEPDENTIPFLGGLDEHALRSGLRRFDDHRQDQGYPKVALFSSAQHREPVVLFPGDCCAALMDAHPMLATSYLEMLLATGGHRQAVSQFFSEGFEGPHALVRWGREEWASLGGAARYLRWLRDHAAAEPAAEADEADPASLGPAGWISLRRGVPYPAAGSK